MKFFAIAYTTAAMPAPRISHRSSWPNPPSMGNRMKRGSSSLLEPEPEPDPEPDPEPERPNTARHFLPDANCGPALHALGRAGQRLEVAPTRGHQPISSSAS